MTATYPPTPPALETFGNVSSCVASSGGTTSPAAGTVESWTMGTGFGSFPAAQQTTVPWQYYYITDPADTTHEMVMVLTGGGGSSTWQVARGACGTTPVAHSSGATWVQVISEGTLQNFKQTAGVSASNVSASGTTEIILAEYQPTTSDLVAGTAFDVIVFGVLPTNFGATKTIQLSLYWGGSGSVGGTYTTTGGALLARILSGTNGPAIGGTTVAAGASFDLNADIVYLSSTTANANMNLFYTTATSLTTAASNATVTNSSSSSPFGSSSSPITISGTGPIFLTVKLGATPITGNLTAVSPIIRRAV